MEKFLLKAILLIKYLNNNINWREEVWRELQNYENDNNFGWAQERLAQTSKEGLLSRGLYRLPRLQEIVLPAATANIMLLHATQKQEQNKKHSRGIAIYLV